MEIQKGEEIKKTWKDHLKTVIGFIVLLLGLFLMSVQSHASTEAPAYLSEVKITGLCNLMLNTGEQVVFEMAQDGKDIDNVLVQSGRAMIKDQATGFYLNCRMKGEEIKAEYQLDPTAIANYCIASNNHDSKRFTGETLESVGKDASRYTAEWEKDGAGLISLDCQGSGAVFRITLQPDTVFTKITEGK